MGTTTQLSGIVGGEVFDGSGFVRKDVGVRRRALRRAVRRRGAGRCGVLRHPWSGGHPFPRKRRRRHVRRRRGRPAQDGGLRGFARHHRHVPCHHDAFRGAADAGREGGGGIRSRRRRGRPCGNKHGRPLHLAEQGGGPEPATCAQCCRRRVRKAAEGVRRPHQTGGHSTRRARRRRFHKGPFQGRAHIRRAYLHRLRHGMQGVRRGSKPYNAPLQRHGPDASQESGPPSRQAPSAATSWPR